ncbi:MAG: HAD family hydrolase [Verrucomicrobium sp.]
MIRAVLFDLDRTLLDRDSSIQAFAVSQFEKFQSRLGDTAREEFVEAFIRLDARGLKWKDAVYQALVQELSLVRLSWEELYADFLACVGDFYRPFPGLHEMLTDLGTKYTLGLITNGRTEFQKRTITALGIASFQRNPHLRRGRGEET